MSVYHPSFNFLNKNSYNDYNLIVVHFDGDSGETDTWLGMEPIYSESYDGTKRLDYGAKFNSVAKPRITVIKSDGTDFTTKDVRDILRWMTGSRKNSYLELCEWDDTNGEWQSQLRFLGRTTAAYQQKMDARTVGLIFEFTTASPFAYSPIKSEQKEFSGETIIELKHESDDFDTPICLDVQFTNTSADGVLTISSGVMSEPTEVKGMLVGETITLNSNGFITTDAERSINNNFNYIFPQIGYDEDLEKVETINVNGSGSIIVTYIYFIKLGDIAIDIDVSSGGISCDHSAGAENGSGGTVVVGEITWSNVKNKPTTLAGYGIEAEVDAKIANAAPSAKIDIDETELNEMLEEVLN